MKGNTYGRYRKVERVEVLQGGAGNNHLTAPKLVRPLPNQETKTIMKTMTKVLAALVPTVAWALSSTSVKRTMRPLAEATSLAVKGEAVVLKSLQQCSAFKKDALKKTTTKKSIPLVGDGFDYALPESERYEAELSFPQYAAEYWIDPRIHGFGNVGFGGMVHAFVAPLFTKALDLFAYKNRDVRVDAWDLVKEARENLGLKATIKKAADLGTGTGYTARSLARAFYKVEKGTEEAVDVIGLDTSKEMLKAAKDLTLFNDDATLQKVTFKVGNAENTGLESKKFDLVTVSFVMHECPREARHKILREAFRLLAPGGTVCVLDIAPDYTPSRYMLPGEPYLPGYLDLFDDDCDFFADLLKDQLAAAYRDTIIPKRLNLWHFHTNQDYLTVKK